MLGETRRYTVHVPAGTEPRQVLFAFHGAGGTPDDLRAGTRLDDVAAILDAVVVYPDASHFNWAEDCGCTNADVVHGVADTAFVSAIATELATEFGLPDVAHLAVGFSQGGMFVHRLACQMSDRFRAVAIVAATMSVPLAERCDPAWPVGVLSLLSTEDPIFPWGGVDEGSLSTLGARALSDGWAARNGCMGTVTDTDEIGRTRREYAGCPSGAFVKLIGVWSGTHSWIISPSVDTDFEVARFLQG